MLLRRTLQASIIRWQNFSTSNAVLSKAKKTSPLAELRKKSGYSLTLCKDALAKNENDVARAFQWLDEQAQAQGWNKAGKLEGRTTTQGLIGIQVKDNSAVMVELNCETDFVARNKQFLSLLQSVTDLNLTAAADTSQLDGEFSMKILEKEDLDEIKQPDGKNLADLLALNIGQIGENITLKRAVHFKSSLARSKLYLVGLTHPSGDVTKCSYGRWGVLLAIEKDPSIKLPKDESPISLGVKLCNHIIGMNPESVGNLQNPQTWPKSKEKSSEQEPIITESSTVKGEENPYGDYDTTASEDEFKTSETEMIHQPFLFDSDRLVRDVLFETGLDVKGFVRYEVGQQGK